MAAVGCSTQTRRVSPPSAARYSAFGGRTVGGWHRPRDGARQLMLGHFERRRVAIPSYPLAVFWTSRYTHLEGSLLRKIADMPPEMLAFQRGVADQTSLA